MEREMSRLSRRRLLGSAVATAAAVTLGAPSVHAHKRVQTVRFVAQADLKIVDPVWTTAYITRNHGYLVYDTRVSGLLVLSSDRVTPTTS